MARPYGAGSDNQQIGRLLHKLGFPSDTCIPLVGMKLGVPKVMVTGLSHTPRIVRARARSPPRATAAALGTGTLGGVDVKHLAAVVVGIGVWVRCRNRR